MKQIVCGICNDFRALAPKGSVSCRCGNVTGWWVDSKRGIAKVKATHKYYVRILGMDNSFLTFAFNKQLERTTDPCVRDEEWRGAHGVVVELSEGYLFHKTRRACPFVLINVGETSDVTWANDDELPTEDRPHGN